MEYWNNVLKTYNFSVWIKVFGINFHYLSMNIFIGSGDNHPLVAIMALPNPPEADPFLMSKNLSKRKIRRRGLRLVEPTPRREYAIHDHKMCIDNECVLKGCTPLLSWS